MKVLQGIAVFIGTILYLCIRGLLLWVFLIPSVLAWLLGLLLWPLFRLFSVRLPASPLYYSRWATHLLDAILSRITPLPSSPWPWQMDVRNSRAGSWIDAF